MNNELKNEFTWSKSRDEVFRECLRKYYFQYYGYWNGWKKEADARTREIYVLKKIRNRWMWAGEHVHRQIQRHLESVSAGAPRLSSDDLVRACLDSMRQEFRDSRAGRYRENPSKICGLHEHEYALPVADAEWKANAAHVEQCIRNFFEMEAAAKLGALPASDWLEIEKLESFDIRGVKVYVRLDAAFREEGGVTIYDWKTGADEPDRHGVQRACYALYAAEKWKAAAGDIRVKECALATKNEREFVFTPEQLEETRDYILDSADEMTFPLSDPERNLAEEDAFDFVEQESVCRRCVFLKACPRWTG